MSGFDVVTALCSLYYLREKEMLDLAESLVERRQASLPRLLRDHERAARATGAGSLA